MGPLRKIISRLLRPLLREELSLMNSAFTKSHQADIFLKGQQAALTIQLSTVHLSNINAYEFKAFSQFGDDGIIQYLINTLSISNKTFVEFGVENYEEANTRFLLMHNNWRGLVIDANQAHINHITSRHDYWMYDLTAVCSFITKENINEILAQHDFSGQIGILSIDIDGNDYWIWKEINVINPEIVIVEYNSVFGAERAITIPYASDFSRSAAHYSHLYAGCSLAALAHLATQKGYSLAGSNKAGNNAYFVRNDKLQIIKAKSVNDVYVASNFRESRNKNGQMNFVSGTQRLACIKGMPVVNTITGENETL